MRLFRLANRGLQQQNLDMYYNVVYPNYKELDMPRPTSFRLPEDVLARLEEEASLTKVSITSLVAVLLDEGLKVRQFPGIVYRNGPTGRRAGLVDGPDVWEIVRELKQVSGKGEPRVQALAQELDMPVQQVRLAIDFYCANAAEIDERITADANAAEEIRERILRRESLLLS